MTASFFPLMTQIVWQLHMSSFNEKNQWKGQMWKVQMSDLMIKCAPGIRPHKMFHIYEFF